MAVAAVDSYLHRLVLQRASRVRKAGDLPNTLRRVSVDFGELAGLADTSIQARRGGTASRPWVHAKNALHRRLLQMTFQSAEQVATALSMSGIEKPWRKIGDEMKASVPDMQKRLNSVVHRRNEIVHESDVPRKARPRHLEFNPVDQTTVLADLDWIESLICAIDAVAQA
jgi:hypothetical protein